MGLYWMAASTCKESCATSKMYSQNLRSSRWCLTIFIKPNCHRIMIWRGLEVRVEGAARLRWSTSLSLRLGFDSCSPYIRIKLRIMLKIMGSKIQVSIIRVGNRKLHFLIWSIILSLWVASKLKLRNLMGLKRSSKIKTSRKWTIKACGFIRYMVAWTSTLNRSQQYWLKAI